MSESAGAPAASLPPAPATALGLSMMAPVMNEAENVPELVARLDAAGRASGRTYEIILVDDGSTDDSPAVYARLAEQFPALRVLLLRRNYGQSAAMTAGFNACRGAFVVSLDGDLQNDPADIPALLAKLGEGHDAVCGWRKDRQDRLVDRKLPSRAANWLIKRFTKVPLHDFGCSLRAYRREYVENLTLYGQLHRFIPVLVSFEGARIAEMVVRHHPRTKGQSKYNLSRLPKVALDLLLMVFFQRFSTRPLQFFGPPGAFCFAGGVAVLLYLTSLKLFLNEDIGQRPLLLLGALLVLFGGLLIGLGLIAELVVRALYESSGKRIYAVRREIRGGPVDR